MTPQQRLLALLAKKKELRQQAPELSSAEITEQASTQTLITAEEWEWHEDQLRAIKEATKSKHIAVTGPAGSGKTTVEVEIATRIARTLSSVKDTDGHKYLRAGTPGIIFISFTNKAVENTRSKLPADLKHNAMTIHKLLEFQPEFTEEWDPVKCKSYTKREFVPSRNSVRVIPTDVKVICMDESTMTGIPLWNQLIDAISPNAQVQFILFGDIQQLPPVFGKSIFIHAMQAGITSIELTHVHRQALKSPILSLAHRILSGKVIPAPELPEWEQKTEHGNLIVKPWKKSLIPEKALEALGHFLPALIDSGDYEPINDVILTPFNKAFGTIEINKIVATHLARGQDNPVYEVLGGISTKYFRVGDKVLWNKTEHIVTAIEDNLGYIGPAPQTPSNTLDYWGIEHDKTKVGAMASFLLDDLTEQSETYNSSVDDFLNKLANKLDTDGESPSGRAISAKITIQPQGWDTEEYGAPPEITLDTSGELAALELAYAITVHKSQGSEYNRVLFITHKSQGNMIFRELVYTAVTRAKQELIIICEPNLFVKGITQQRLPGKNLADKIASFDRYVELNKGRGGEFVEPAGLWMFEPNEE